MSEGIIKTAIICLTVVAVFYIMSKVMIAEYARESNKEKKDESDSQ